MVVTCCRRKARLACASIKAQGGFEVVLLPWRLFCVRLHASLRAQRPRIVRCSERSKPAALPRHGPQRCMSCVLQIAIIACGDEAPYINVKDRLIDVYAWISTLGEDARLFGTSEPSRYDTLEAIRPISFQFATVHDSHDSASPHHQPSASTPGQFAPSVMHTPSALGRAHDAAPTLHSAHSAEFVSSFRSASVPAHPPAEASTTAERFIPELAEGLVQMPSLHFRSDDTIAADEMFVPAADIDAPRYGSRKLTSDARKSAPAGWHTSAAGWAHDERPIVQKLPYRDKTQVWHTMEMQMSGSKAKTGLPTGRLNRARHPKLGSPSLLHSAHQPATLPSW